MKEKEQIEEIAKITFDYVDSKYKQIEPGNMIYLFGSSMASNPYEFKRDSHNYGLANYLYNAGYQKSDEVRKETAQDILKSLYNYPNEYHEKKIIELAKKYGVEVEE